MNKLYVFITALFLSSSAFCAEIVTDTEIAKIASTADGTDNFWVQTKGGTGPCAGAGAGIIFPKSATPTQSSHNRAFSLALAAHTTKSIVRIYNFQGNDCDNAGHLEIMSR